MTQSNGIQVLARYTPDIHYRTAGGGSWDTTTNWTVGLRPGAPHHVFVDPPVASGTTINGPADDVSIKTLTIGARGAGSASLVMNNGGQITVGGAGGGVITIAPNGTLNIQSGGISGTNLTNSGTLSQSFGSTLSLSILQNNSFASLAGASTISTLLNTSSLSINNGASLTLAGGLTNSANLTIDNGAITGAITNDFGASMNARGSISTTLTNNGTLSLTGLLTVGNILNNNGQINLSLGDNLRLPTLQNAGQITLTGGAITIGANGQIDNNLGGVIQGGGNTFQSLRNVAGLIHANNAQPLVVNNFLGNQAGGQIRIADGSTLSISSTFSNAGVITLSGGSATLSSSTITNPGNIRGSGMIGAPVSNTGTIHAEDGTLSLMGSGNTNTAVGQIQVPEDATVLYSQGLATNAGTIALTGGSFDNNNQAMSNTGRLTGWGNFSAGSLVNNGLVTFTGGFTTINGTVINAATRQIRVAHNPALFTGNVTNNGIFKNTETTITFAGTYTENGTFISDPADNFFSSVSIGDEGAWVGGWGDRFFITGDLRSTSKARSSWQTNLAELHLTGSVDHILSVAGEDRGVSFDGYVDNFAWGALIVGGGDGVTLEDANADAGGALYVRQLLLAGGIGQINKIDSNGLNIYYDLGDSANSYLGGHTYALAGGGSISAVPEPATMSIVLLAMTTLARRRREKQ
jgi:hypothetical protein